MVSYWIHAINVPNWELEISRGFFLLGISKRWKGLAKRVQKGDYIIFYIMQRPNPRDPRAKMISGLFRVASEVYYETSQVWPDGVYPHRAKLEPVLVAERAEQMLPIKPLIQKLKFIPNKKNWGRAFQTALLRMPKADFKLIKRELEKAIAASKQPTVDDDLISKFKHTHTSVEWALLFMGRSSGFETWVTGSDRNKKFRGAPIGAESLRSLPSLGVGFKVQEFIEGIDVLWLERNKVIAAFEVEHTTNIRSGLTRLNDIILAAPNLRIDLFIVAPDERERKLQSELNRPSFEQLRGKVKFITYSTLVSTLSAARKILDLGGTLKADFLTRKAEAV